MDVFLPYAMDFDENFSKCPRLFFYEKDKRSAVKSPRRINIRLARVRFSFDVFVFGFLLVYLQVRYLFHFFPTSYKQRVIISILIENFQQLRY